MMASGQLLCLLLTVASSWKGDAFVQAPSKVRWGAPSLSQAPLCFRRPGDIPGESQVAGGWRPLLRGASTGNPRERSHQVSLAAKGKGKGAAPKPGAKKGGGVGGGVRADELLVSRGLADNSNHALLLILKGQVIADEGKMKVDGAGTNGITPWSECRGLSDTWQLLPADTPLRLKKGSKGATTTLQQQTPVASEGEGQERSEAGEEDSQGGFRLGQEAEGLVVAHHGTRVIVESVDERLRGVREGRVSCAITPLLKERGILTGDRVRFAEALDGDTGVSNNTAWRRGIVTERLDRKTVLVRPAKAFAIGTDMNPVTGLEGGGGGKYMCSNVDQMCIVISQSPPMPPLMLESHIIGAINSGLAPVIVVNKCDVEIPGEALPDLTVYERLGYQVVRVSTVTGMGIQDLEEILRGKVSILVGQSGVGKSSLVNRLLPSASARVGGLSDYTGLGSHTTTHAELHRIPSGGDLIDCAGFRDFGTWHYTHEEIQAGFEEIEQLSLECKYKNCRHRSEPECKVREAVERGKIDPSRLIAFHELTVP